VPPRKKKIIKGESINLRLESEQLARWRAAAKDHGITLTELIRRSVEAELQRLDRQRERD